MTRTLRASTFVTLVLLTLPAMAAAQERLCDAQFEDCRTPLLNLIRDEKVGIDVAFWFMEDSRYSTELIRRHQAGVPVRVLVDQRANKSKRLNETILATLRDAGIPMREKYAGCDILHFKMMLFHGQNVVQFSKANYASGSFNPWTANVNYMDETIYFTNDDNLTNSFRRRFDDLWVDTSVYRNFANVTGPLTRTYSATLAIHPSMNFPPLQSFATRSVSRYDAESALTAANRGIDVFVYRVTDARHSDAMIRAVARGTPVRLITEPSEYRNPSKLWHSKQVDRMYMGGVPIKHRKHEGLTHQASVVMHGLGEVIFGSSNWSEASDACQDEHNYFYSPSLGKPWFFQWFADQFERKWNDTANYVPFQPLPPGTPAYSSPQNGAAVSTTVTLTWDGGIWAHLYDIYFGTNSNPPLLANNLEVGSPVEGQLEKYLVGGLVPGTTYYWRIVGKTWAQVGKSGPTWMFTTSGTPPPSGAGSPFGGTPAAVPGTFQAENFDDGGQSIAYYDTSAGNSGKAYRSTDVDIEATSDTGSGYNVGWTRAGEWLKYTVNVGATGTYTFEARVANIGAGGTFRVEVDGVDRTGPVSVPDTGAWQTWQTITKSGVPLTAGTRVIRIVLLSAASGGGAGNYNWFRFVQSTSPPSGSTPYGGTPVAVPGTFQAENFDNGGQSIAYYDKSAGNSGTAYRSTDVDIEASSDTGGGYNVGWTRAGEWLKYTVTVSTTGTYTLDARVANVGTGATFRVEVDGVDRTGPIAVPDTGAWQGWQTVTKAGIPLAAGTRVIRVVFVSVASSGGVGNYNWFRFEQSTSSATAASHDLSLTLPDEQRVRDTSAGLRAAHSLGSGEALPRRGPTGHAVRSARRGSSRRSQVCQRRRRNHR